MKKKIIIITIIMLIVIINKARAYRWPFNEGNGPSGPHRVISTFGEPRIRNNVVRLHAGVDINSSNAPSGSAVSREKINTHPVEKVNTHPQANEIPCTQVKRNPFHSTQHQHRPQHPCLCTITASLYNHHAIPASPVTPLNPSRPPKNPSSCKTETTSTY